MRGSSLSSVTAHPAPVTGGFFIPTEHAEQVAFVRWWRLQHPALRIMAIPNGGARNKITGAMLKAEGATRGVPDLFVPARMLWIEMKRQKGGTVSPDQRDWHAYLRECGHTVIVAKGCIDAIDQVLGLV